MDKFIKRFFCVGNYMRHYRGLTMEDVEKQSGIPRMNISHMESNISSARMGTAIALAEFYGISLDALLRNDFAEMSRCLGKSPTPQHQLYKKFAKIAQICQQNGLAGEEFIFLQEREKLEHTIYSNAVNPNYADDMSAHCDIMSWEKDGTPILIEVKSTNKGPDEPFYMSHDELTFARDCVSNGIQYEIHRVYYVNDKAKMNSFTITGEELLSQYDHTPTTYRIRKKCA